MTLKNPNRPIGIFDSGIGGLTVVKEFIRQLPDEELIYFGDTARFPYGTRSPEMVKSLALENSKFLLSSDVKMIVVACNTASSVALELLENELPVPVLGVVKPGAMSALKATRNGIIGIIGTSATVASGSYQRELVRISPNIKSVAAACPLFVSLAEEGWVSGPVVRMVAEKYLEEFRKSGIDTLILGCTHYPLLRAVINEILGDKVVLVDSAEAAVRGVFELLERENGFKRDGKKPHHKFYVSDSPDRFRKVGERFLSEPIDEVLKVALEDVSSF